MTSKQPKMRFKMIISKRHIILAALVVALGLAVYLQWQFTDIGSELPASAFMDDKEDSGDTAEEGAGDTLRYGEAQYTGADLTDVIEMDDDYFVNARLERKKSADAAIETINTMLTDAALSEEEEEEMKAKVTSLALSMEKESMIENVLKAKGFEECIVYLGDESVDVIVRTPGLLSTEAAQIKDVLLSETEVAVENIKLIPVK